MINLLRGVIASLTRRDSEVMRQKSLQSNELFTADALVPRHDPQLERSSTTQEDNLLNELNAGMDEGNWDALYHRTGLGGPDETEIVQDTEKFGMLASLLVRRFQANLDPYRPLGKAIANHCIRAGTTLAGKTHREKQTDTFERGAFIGHLIRSDSETLRHIIQRHHRQIFDQGDLLPFIIKRCFRNPSMLLPHQAREEHAALYEEVGIRCAACLRAGVHPALRELLKAEMDTPPLTASASQLATARIYRDIETLVLDPLPIWKQIIPREGNIRVGLLRNSYDGRGEMEYVDALIKHLDTRIEMLRIGVAPSRGEDGYVSLAELDEIAAIECIRALQLDVLVHTTSLWGSFGSLFARILSARAASIQIMSLGEIRSTAIPAVDYFVFPQDIRRETYAAQFTEVLLTVPWGAPRQHVLYQPQPLESSYRNKPCIMVSNAHVRKISHELLFAWAKILARVPDAEIWLFPFSADYHLTQRAQLIAVIEAACQAVGLEIGRFVIRMERGADIIRRCMAEADIYLDSFPYNGHFSLAEALAANLPCVCLSATSYHSQLSRMLLASLDLDRLLLASSEADYIDRAVRLGNDVAERSSIRGLIHDSLTKLDRNRDEEYYSKSFWATVVNQVTSQHRDSQR